MQQNKLLTYLMCLDAEEMKRFTRFMQSPYHTTNKPARAMVEALAKYHPAFDSSRLKKELLFQKIYGTNRPFHEGRLDQVMTQTLQLLNQFLAIENMMNSPLEMNKNRMGAMRKRKIDNAFFKGAKKREQLIENMPEGPERYLEGYQLFKDLFFHPATNRHLPEMKSIEKYVENLDWFILWEKQLTTNFLLNRQIVLSKKYDLKLHAEITEAFAEKVSNHYTLFILNKISEQQHQIDEKEMLALIDDYLENIDKIEKALESIVYALIRNLLAKGMRQSPEIFTRPLFKMMRMAHQKKWDLVEGKLTTNQLTGFVSVASKVGEFEYAENLIKNNLHLIDPADKVDVENLGYGYIYFWKGCYKNTLNYYDLAIGYLLKANQNKSFFSYQIKSLLLRCYYEVYLNDTDQQFFINDFSLAFERHLARDDSLSENKAEAYRNFCRYIRKLTKLKYQKENLTAKKDALSKQAASEKILFAREWIEEKIKGL